MSEYFSQSQNFIEAIDSGIDPRNGSFSFKFPIVDINANYGMGPDFSLSINNNSTNKSDIGFGIGFAFSFSNYDKKRKILTLSTGEQYAMIDTPISFQVKQKKLNNFIIERYNDYYKITYKSGVIELLEKPSSLNDIKNTIRIENYLGYYIDLEWINKSGSRLSKVIDKNSTLLNINYDNLQAPIITLFPSTDNQISYQLKIFNKYLKEIIQTESKYTWIFDYNKEGMIDKINHPFGKVEIIDYQPNVFRFPEDVNPPLTAAVRHRVSVKGEQPDYVTSYKYTNTNYLGFGSGLNFMPDRDNLYTLLTNYEYGSTEIQKVDDVTTETKRTYNSFHLLIKEEKTYISSNKRFSIDTENEYYAQKGVSFEKQPSQFQLLKQKKVTYREYGGKSRQEIYKSEFDEQGNLLFDEQPDGTKTTITWYSSNGEDGAPADKNGFVRLMKGKTILPPQDDYKTPALSQTYTYGKLDSSDRIVLKQQHHRYNNSLLQIQIYTYNKLTTGIDYGAKTGITTLLVDINDKKKNYSSEQTITREINNNRINEKGVFTGHDGCQLITQKIFSVGTLALLSETNQDGVTTQYRYDILGRLLSTTHAAGTRYSHTTRWLYETTDDGFMVHEISYNNNQSKIYFDGLGRKIKEYKFDNDETNEWYLISSQQHNEVGDIKNKTIFDYQRLNNKKQSFALETTTHYDIWGEVDSIFFSNGVTAFEQKDPITLTELRYHSGEASNSKINTGKWLIERNVKNKLVQSEHRLSQDNTKIASKYFYWDGLGRLYKEIDEMGNITERTYDAYDRVIAQKLQDGTLIEQTYSPHLTGNQIASITVSGMKINKLKLGTQEFDSLGRLLKQESGGRTTLYQYSGASLKPSVVTLPSKEKIYYKYIPELDNVVSQIKVGNITQNFYYDEKTGEQIKSEEGKYINNMYWNLSGTLKEEMTTLPTAQRGAKYQWTLAGNPVSYIDITGNMTSYQRDKYGRINRIIDKAITVDIEYDALGRQVLQSVVDNSTSKSLKTKIEYDEFDQEIKRIISASNDEQIVVEKSWLKNGLLARQSTFENSKKIHDELYKYDNRNRLIQHEILGESFPADGYGYQISKKQYGYDEINNMFSATTTFPNGDIDDCSYGFGNSQDPTQLTKVSHTNAQYPHSITLKYDECGRMIFDESGRTLNYDPLGRLIQVKEEGKYNSLYSYNALNQLVEQKIDNNTRQLYYRSNELVNEVAAKTGHDIRLLKSGNDCLAVNNPLNTTLLGKSHNNSLLYSKNSDEKEGKLHQWTAYGEGEATEHLPAYNGELADPVSGVYHLGNGFRAYNPKIMRFNCPDDLSPFGEGGINPYTYCLGDPINRTDPSGHLSDRQITGLAIGGVGILLSVLTFGSSLAASGAILASLTLGFGVTSEVLSGVGIAVKKDNPQAASALETASLVFGVASIFTGLGAVGKVGAKIAQNSNRFSPVITNTTGKGQVIKFEKFNLYRSLKGTDRLIITSHGYEAFLNSKAMLLNGQKLNFLSKRGYGIQGHYIGDLVNNTFKPRETIEGAKKVINYNLSNYDADTVNEIWNMIRQNEGLGIITITKNTDLKSVLKELNAYNLKYGQIDCSFCRTTTKRAILEDLKLTKVKFQPFRTR